MEKFWEEAHKSNIFKNWTELEEKLPFLIKSIEYVKSKNPRALDLGCSTGNYSIVLGQKGFEVLGIDISPTAIRKARNKIQKQNLKNIQFKTGDVRKFTCQNNFYDLILDLSCFTHLNEKYWPEYIQKLSAILKPEGILLVSVWSKNSKNIYGIDASKLKGSSFLKEIKPYGKFYNYFFTKEKIKEIFQNHFEILEMKESPANSFKKINPESDLKFIFAIFRKK